MYGTYSVFAFIDGVNVRHCVTKPSPLVQLIFETNLYLGLIVRYRRGCLFP